MSDVNADAVVLCPGCAKSWPPGTKYCENCSTSLHNAKKYVAYTQPTTSPQAHAVTALNPVVQPAPTIHDDALDRVRANGYWAQRARATKMTIIGYFQFIVGGFMLFVGAAALFTSCGTSLGAISANNLASLLGLSGYIISLVSFVIGYRMLLSGFTTFSQRDELLMRIDVAMNTALMATQLTSLTQHMTAQQKHDK